MTSFVNRMIGAAKFNVKIYEEVEGDTGAMPQAMGVVVLSAIAAGIGTVGKAGIGGLFIGVIAALVAWYVWALATYLIGTKLLPEPQTSSNVGELLRTIGFSSSPGIIRVLGFIPGIRGVLFFVASVWMLVAMVIAVRQALDYHSTLRAVGVCAIGWIIQMLIMGLVFFLLGGAGTGG